LDGSIIAPPLLLDHKLYVRTCGGNVYEINKSTGSIEGIFFALERITNQVTHNPNTKLFFVTTHSNEIYCLKRNLEQDKI